MTFSSRRRNYMLVSHRRDALIELIKQLLKHSFVLDALAESAENTWRHVEELIEEHRVSEDGNSRLREAVPTIGTFFTSLPLARAWHMFDEKFQVSKRRFISPSFNEIREVLNSAQILAFEKVDDNTALDENHSTLEFVSFDGDCTLYSDGKNFNDPELAEQIQRLLVRGIRVALVTAAGYGYDSEKYEKRLGCLLHCLESSQVDAKILQNFYVLGGEANYLFQCNYIIEKSRKRAALLPLKETWEGLRLGMDDEEQIQYLLDVAESSISNSIIDLQLSDARFIRKPRAVGVVPKVPRREILDEIVLRVQDALRKCTKSNLGASSVPWCAFNGGSDVFVDIGNKKVGVNGLQQLFHLKSNQVLHIGDQFLISGNDYAARSACCCLWITNPNETKATLLEILHVVEQPHSCSDPDDYLRHPPQPLSPTPPSRLLRADSISALPRSCP